MGTNRKKTALVTGADHGVGLALVRELLLRGYRVTACRINEEERQIDALQDAYPDRLTVLRVDIGSDESVERMRQEVEAACPALDLLINDAGILGDIEKTAGDVLDYEEMLHVINVNAVGTLRVSNALLDLVMKSEGKTIVNISSEAGSIADCYRTGWFGYCMSKAANNMQGALIHNAIRDKGGRVIQIHPGHVATYMRGHLDTTARITPEISAKGILQVVLDRELPLKEHPLYLDFEGTPLPF